MKRHILRYILLISFILLFLLGVWGWRISSPDCLHPPCQPYDWLDSIYKTIKLLVIDEAGQVDNWQLNIARFTLPLFTLTTLIGIIFKTLGKQFNFIRLRFKPRKTIVFGLDHSALIATAHIQENNKLFVDLSDAGLDYNGSIVKKVPMLIHLGQLNDNDLKSLNLSATKEIYILTGNDERNIQLAQTLIGLLKKATPRLLINIDNQAILRIACREEIFINYRKKGGEINWFNRYRQAARTLLKGYPPLNIPSSQHTGNVHVAVVGFNAFSQQLILNLVKHCVYLGETKLVVSVFSSNLSDYNLFIENNPALSANSDTLGFGGFDIKRIINHYVISDTVFPPSVVKQSLDDNGIFTKVYVTDETDYGVIERAQRVKQGLLAIETESSIVACLPNSHFYDLDEINNLSKNDNDNKESNPLSDIAFFSILGQGIDTIGDRELGDVLAKIVHTAYECAYKNLCFETHYKIVEEKWNKLLEEDFRQSSRYSADHFFVKLRELGYELSKKEVDSENDFNPHTLFYLHKDIQNHLAALNKMEHQRFCHERFIDGWFYAQETNRPVQLNNTLIPFDPLSGLEKQKDQAIIESIMFILKNKEVNKHFVLKKLEK